MSRKNERILYNKFYFGEPKVPIRKQAKQLIVWSFSICMQYAGCSILNNANMYQVHIEKSLCTKRIIDGVCCVVSL